MTKQASQIIDTCGFSIDSLKIIEKTVVSHTTKQIISLIKKKDPNGNNIDFSWFVPFFTSGYIPKIIDISVLFDDDFWKAYFMLDVFVDPFDVSLLPLINEMSMNTSKLEQVILVSKPHIKYVYKVWQNTEYVIVPTTDISEIEVIKKHEVRTIKFN